MAPPVSSSPLGFSMREDLPPANKVFGLSINKAFSKTVLKKQTMPASMTNPFFY
jgi:hypothetical protein